VIKAEHRHLKVIIEIMDVLYLDLIKYCGIVVSILLSFFYAASTIRLFTFSKMKFCDSETRLDGKVVVVTGGNTGIGKEIVLEMAERGAKVITGCRDLKKAADVVKIVKDKFGVDVLVEKLDLSDFESVRSFANFCLKELRIDILVNNAGLMMPKHGAQTKQGFEIHFGVNYLGHYLLTELLYPLLAKSGTKKVPSRVVNVSSAGYQFTLWKGLDVEHEQFGYINWAYTGTMAFHRMYGQSKLAQIYHARDISMQAAEKGDNVVGYSLHPGTVKTEITRYHGDGDLSSFFVNFVETVMSLSGKTPNEGAQTVLYCCLTDTEMLTSGGFYDDCTLVDDYRMKNWYSNPIHQTRLRQVSDEMVKDYLKR